VTRIACVLVGAPDPSASRSARQRENSVRDIAKRARCSRSDVVQFLQHVGKTAAELRHIDLAAEDDRDR
jgi:hypothetical protein